MSEESKDQELTDAASEPTATANESASVPGAEESLENAPMNPTNKEYPPDELRGEQTDCPDEPVSPTAPADEESPSLDDKPSSEHKGAPPEADNPEMPLQRLPGATDEEGKPVFVRTSFKFIAPDVTAKDLGCGVVLVHIIGTAVPVALEGKRLIKCVGGQYWKIVKA